MAKVDVRSQVLIGRPLAEVADFAGNPANAPAWYVNIESVEWQSPPPAAVGTRVAFVATFLGRRLSYTYELVELTPRRSLVMRTVEGPFPMETTYTWEAVDDRATRMTLRNRGAPSGFFALLAPLVARAIGRANRKDLAALKQLLERGAA